MQAPAVVNLLVVTLITMMIHKKVIGLSSKQIRLLGAKKIVMSIMGRHMHRRMESESVAWSRELFV